MPEPAPKDGDCDPYVVDRPGHPLEDGDQKVNLRQYAKFLSFTYFSTVVTVLFTAHSAAFYESAPGQQFWYQEQFQRIVKMVVYNAALVQTIYAGNHPRWYLFRSISQSMNIWYQWEKMNKHNNDDAFLDGTASAWNQYEVGQAQDEELANNIVFVLLTVSFVLVFRQERVHGDRSFAGRCCCEGFQHARMTRIGITIILLMVSYLWGIYAVLSLQFHRSRLVATMVSPLVVFSHKRFVFVGSNIFILNDTPIKHVVCYLGIFSFAVLMVGSAVSTATGCRRFEDVSSFICIDTMLFTLRAALILRLGQRQSPKLFNLMLQKTIENFVVPMSQAEVHLGCQSAMKVHQALYCFCEGLLFFIISLQFAVSFLERKIEPVSLKYVFPANNFMVVAVLICSSSLQLAFGERYLYSKISTFSVVFVSWLSKKWIFMFWVMVLGPMTCTNSIFNVLARVVVLRQNSMIVDETRVAMSAYSALVN